MNEVHSTQTGAIEGQSAEMAGKVPLGGWVGPLGVTLHTQRAQA